MPEEEQDNDDDMVKNGDDDEYALPVLLLLLLLQSSYVRFVYYSKSVAAMKLSFKQLSCWYDSRIYIAR